MSLYSSLQLANNAMRAQQVGLQVVGQNIANANTPGYLREQVLYQTAPTQQNGRLLLGLGVQVEGVVQRVDRFLEERLRSASSDRTSAEIQEQTHLQLETIIGELEETDLSTSLNRFFSSISEVLNQPESAATRNLAVLQGETLTADIRNMHQRVQEAYRGLDKQIQGHVEDVNRLLTDISKLNIRIAEFEGGETSSSDAVGLRDQRSQALTELAGLIDVRTAEQESGVVNVFAGGDFLVFEGTARLVTSQTNSVDGLPQTTIKVIDSDSPLQITSGKIAGLARARDEVLGGFLTRLDRFALTLASEFNRLHTSGQGLSGYQTLESERAVDAVDQPLDAINLPFSPEHGSFKIQVYNRQTGLTETSDIFVDLDGLDDDTTFESLVAAIDAVDGVSATITPESKVQISSDAPEQDIAFSDDTSGVLTALGLNTFFTGSGAGSININSAIRQDPGLLAASRDGVGSGTSNAVELAAFLDRPLESADGESIGVLYDRLTGETTQAAAISRSVAEGFRAFEGALEGQHLSISGVSLDEEVVNMISLQRAFQATARYVSTVSDLLEVLTTVL